MTSMVFGFRREMRYIKWSLVFAERGDQCLKTKILQTQAQADGLHIRSELQVILREALWLQFLALEVQLPPTQQFLFEQ